MNRPSSFPIEPDAGNVLSDRAVAVRIDRARQILLAGLLALLLLAIGVPALGWRLHDAQIAMLFLMRQDMPLMPLVAAPLLIRFTAGLGRPLPTIDRTGWIMMTSALLLLLCWWGHYAILNGWSLSRDEQMADFDASVFANGRLFWPIPLEWRPYAEALNETFMLPIGGQEGWISGYLPGNAFFRALTGTIADPMLTSPLFVMLGMLCLWRICKQIWPESPDARATTLILYVGSSQILFMGMTAYAMSAHLGLNLLWLVFFLHDNRRSHATAIMIGFLATGLHQPLFHPMFVLPFLAVLLRQGRWRLLAVYVGAYAVIGLFWMLWPIWMSRFGAEPPISTVDIGYGARLLHAFGLFDVAAAWLMAANLLRFAAWQHLLLLPLLALGIVGGWKRDPLVRALTLGLALPIVAMALLLPSQGHGWGYRYLHGVIGNACLLGGYGWQWLEANGRAPRRALLATSLATLFVTIPLHAWMAHETVLAAATANRRIATLPATIAIIDDQAAPFAKDIVLNRPDLSNRPIRLNGSALDPASIPRLCRLGTLAFVDGPSLGALDQLYGLPARTDATPHQRALEDAARAGGCGASKLPDPAANRGRADP